MKTKAPFIAAMALCVGLWGCATTDNDTTMTTADNTANAGSQTDEVKPSSNVTGETAIVTNSGHLVGDVRSENGATRTTASQLGAGNTAQSTARVVGVVDNSANLDTSSSSSTMTSNSTMNDQSGTMSSSTSNSGTTSNSTMSSSSNSGFSAPSTNANVSTGTSSLNNDEITTSSSTTSGSMTSSTQEDTTSSSRTRMRKD